MYLINSSASRGRVACCLRYEPTLKAPSMSGFGIMRLVILEGYWEWRVGSVSSWEFRNWIQEEIQECPLKTFSTK